MADDSMTQCLLFEGSNGGRWWRCLLDRDPVTGVDLASQPTLSRFENSVGPASWCAWAKPWRTSVLLTGAEPTIVHGPFVVDFARLRVQS